MYYSQFPVEGDITNFMYRVYGWMAIALAVTAGVAFYVSQSPQIYQTIQTNPMLLFGIFIGQIVLVVVLSMAIMRISLMTALLLFMVYATSVGLTLSMIFLVYDIRSIYATFAVTALTFGTMCLYGYFTKTDLTRMGNIMLMALLGLIIAMVINMFLRSPMMDFVLSGIGVLLFTGLTAFDAQKIKLLGQQLLGDRETMGKVAVIGALTLYLDFINLFLFMLQFMGRRRE